LIAWAVAEEARATIVIKFLSITVKSGLSECQEVEGENEGQNSK